MNTRQKIEKELRGAGAEGLSKLELMRRVEISKGTFRRVIRQLVDNGEVVVEQRDHPDWGVVHIHRWRGPQPIDGQQEMEAG